MLRSLPSHTETSGKVGGSWHSDRGCFAVCRQAIFAADLSVEQLAHRANLHARQVRRILSRQTHRMVDHAVTAAVALGATIAIRHPHDSWHILAEPIPGLGSPARIALKADGTGRGRSDQQIDPSSWATTANDTGASERLVVIDRRLIARVRQGKWPAGFLHLMCLLAATGHKVIAINHSGAVRVLADPTSEPVQVTTCVARVRPPRRDTGDRAPRTTGCTNTSQLSKMEIFRLYRDRGLDYRTIAQLAGISRERVRQIVVQLGAMPARKAAIQRRRSAFGGQVDPRVADDRTQAPILAF